MENIQEIFTDRIQDPKDPMRGELDRNALYDLADNIKQNGLINPITVRPVGDMFEVVAGHRRLAACRIAGKLKIPCVVRELDDEHTFAVMAAENLERADVDPVDEAIFIKRFIEQTGKSVPEVARVLRRSITFVNDRLLVGEMPDYMQGHLKEGKLKLGAALALVQITDDNIRRVWVEMAVRDGVSVAQAEYWLHGWQVNQIPGAAGINNPPGGYEPEAAGPVMFECAIDGKKYDARTFKSVMIYEGNLPIFKAFVEAYNSDVVSSSIPSAEPAQTPAG